MHESLQGIQRANAQLSKSARNIAALPSADSVPQAQDSVRDMLDLSEAACSIKANAAVFSVAAEMSETVLQIGRRLDRFG
jgi:hypothetical protein